MMISQTMDMISNSQNEGMFIVYCREAHPSTNKHSITCTKIQNRCLQNVQGLITQQLKGRCNTYNSPCLMINQYNFTIMHIIAYNSVTQYRDFH